MNNGFSPQNHPCCPLPADASRQFLRHFARGSTYFKYRQQMWPVNPDQEWAKRKFLNAQRCSKRLAESLVHVSKIDLPNCPRMLKFLDYYHAGHQQNGSETSPDICRVLLI